MDHWGARGRLGIKVKKESQRVREWEIRAMRRLGVKVWVAK